MSWGAAFYLSATPVSSRALAAHDGGALDGSLRVILEASLGRGVSFGGESSSSFGGDSSLKSAAGSSKPLISAAPEGDSDRVDSPSAGPAAVPPAVSGTKNPKVARAFVSIATSGVAFSAACPE